MREVKLNRKRVLAGTGVGAGVVAVGTVAAVAFAQGHYRIPGGSAAADGSGFALTGAEPAHASGGQGGGSSKVAAPDGSRPVASYRATGVQIYRCGDNGQWNEKADPAAVLLDGDRPVGLHSKGPSWVSTRDGSSVFAKPVDGAKVERKGAVPELLLRAHGNEGEGVFGKVRYVQRLQTEGGVKPKGGCQGGARQAVPYTARYAFLETNGLDGRGGTGRQAGQPMQQRPQPTGDGSAGQDPSQGVSQRGSQGTEQAVQPAHGNSGGLSQTRHEEERPVGVYGARVELRSEDGQDQSQDAGQGQRSSRGLADQNVGHDADGTTVVSRSGESRTPSAGGYDGR
jgi:hypothetical protein